MAGLVTSSRKRPANANWKTETQRYNERVADLAEKLVPLQQSFAELPPAPLERPLSGVAHLHYQSCLYVLGTYRSARELSRSVRQLWLSGQFLSASLCIRLLIELWGGNAYLLVEVLQKLQRSADQSVAAGKIARLLHGSKSDVSLPWGGNASEKPIHVMDLLRAADSLKSGTIESYEFLCDASHPSFLQHTYLLFAGSEYDNWSNDQFAKYAHVALERTLKACEHSVSGIAKCGSKILQTSLPIVLAECRD